MNHPCLAHQLLKHSLNSTGSWRGWKHSKSNVDPAGEILWFLFGPLRSNTRLLLVELLNGCFALRKCFRFSHFLFRSNFLQLWFSPLPCFASSLQWYWWENKTISLKYYAENVHCVNSIISPTKNLALFYFSESVASYAFSVPVVPPTRNNSFFPSFEEINEIISPLIYCSEMEVNIGNKSDSFSFLQKNFADGLFMVSFSFSI